MNPFSGIGHRLYSLRQKRGWTQQELADRVNQTRFHPDVKQPHIAGLERSKGEKLPSVPLLAALAEVFEQDMDALVGIEETDNTNITADLSAEDKALVLLLISRLRGGLDVSDWQVLSRSVIANGGNDLAGSIERDTKVLLESRGD